MNIIYKTMTIICLLGVTIGCSYNYSVNMQRSNLRSVGDSTVTASLDSISSTEEALAIRNQTKIITEAIRKFLYSGSIQDLTIEQFTNKLETIVPSNYSSLITLLVSKINGISINTQFIGENNIRRIDAACIGIILACNEYRIEDRQIPIANEESEAKVIIEREVSTKSIEIYNRNILKGLRKK